MHDVDAHAARLRDAHEGVEVGRRSRDSPLRVDDPRDLEDLLLEDPSVLGTVSMRAATSSVIASSSTWRSSVRGCSTSAPDLVPPEVGRGRVGPVRGVRDENGLARVAAHRKRGTNHEDPASSP